MSRWPFSGSDMCEECESIDVRRRIAKATCMPASNSHGRGRVAESSGTINVRTEADAVVLLYRARSSWPVEIYRTADADHLDGLPLRWQTS